MKTLVLIRHAKTKEDAPTGRDYDRALMQVGFLNAVEAGEALHQQGISPDLIIAGSAMRTTQTAKLIADAVNYQQQRIVFLDALYQAYPETYQSVIEAEIPEHINTVFMIGHNPGVSMYAADIIPDLPLDSLPTSGLVAVSFEGAWSEFSLCHKKILFFHTPKK